MIKQHNKSYKIYPRNKFLDPTSISVNILQLMLK